MFERFTERARRVLFFARYEASQLGSLSIETEHLLLGVLREGKGLTSRLFSESHLSLDEVRRAIEARSVFREKVSTSVEIPFSPESKRVLQFAMDESGRLGHSFIGTEHLLLGLLREERSDAAQLLNERGLRLDVVRTRITELLGIPDPSVPDLRTYAIKRARAGTIEGATTVAIVAGKAAAIQAVREHDSYLSPDDRAAGWEHYFEPLANPEPGTGT
jgi:ATP-dependent Clp protease ATP-binding subunit ClpA